jgi:hypothetical protein
MKTIQWCFIVDAIFQYILELLVLLLEAAWIVLLIGVGPGEPTAAWGWVALICLCFWAGVRLAMYLLCGKPKVLDKTFLDEERIRNEQRHNRNRAFHRAHPIWSLLVSISLALAMCPIYFILGAVLYLATGWSAAWILCIGASFSTAAVPILIMWKDRREQPVPTIEALEVQ